MHPNTRFIAPYGVTSGKRHFWRAMINGAWVEADTFGAIQKQFETERAAYRKAQRAKAKS